MRDALLRWGPLALVLLLAGWLRTSDLARRPMHADEANQAVKAGELLETGHYAYDPRDHHGPTLYYAAVVMARIRGQTTLAALDEITVRLVPALCGTVSVLLLWWLAQPLGRGPALATAAFLAVSPPAVYYSRFFIQETLLVTFTLAVLVSAQQWWRSGLTRWAIAGGACLGLMLATKVTAPFFAAFGLAAVVLAGGRRPFDGRARRDLALAIGAALVVAALFYSSFGTHLGGLRDALTAYGHIWTRATGDTGQEKPWWYYLRLFAWQRTGGLVWEQVAFSLLALAGLGLAWFSGSRLARWAAVYTLLVVALFSFTPYKTPWHAVHFVPGMALLAGVALAALLGRWLALAPAGVTLALLASQTWRAAFLRPADERNPYAYVHSSPDVRKYRALVEQALARSPGRPVRVIGEEYWPLPWQLRGLANIGYWATPPDDCDGALVIVTMTQAAVVRARLHGSYDESFLGLRPGVLCAVFTPAQ